MMRAMRVIYKPVFVVVAVTFIGWLAYGQVTDILGGGRDVVLKVNGEIVRATQFQAALQNAIDESRRRGGGRLSREDEQQLQDQVTDQFIQRILLEREYRRLGIQVSDDEIRQMARSTPPPQILRQIMEDPTFQTNGQFDITKWQRYLGSASEEFRAQVEALYREYIPQRKLEEYLTADVYVSDAKLWRIWRDQHESVTVAVLAVTPDRIPDSLVSISDAELERYYAAHKDAYKRPSVAWLSFVAVSRAPDAADSAAALAKAKKLRAQIAGGKVKFEDTAKRESADSGSGARGGDLGWVKRSEPTFDPQFLAGMQRLRAGELSQPVRSSFGYHLIRVEAARGDSLHVRHILIAIAPEGKHLESLEARADTGGRGSAQAGSIRGSGRERVGLRGPRRRDEPRDRGRRCLLRVPARLADPGRPPAARPGPGPRARGGAPGQEERPRAAAGRPGVRRRHPGTGPARRGAGQGSSGREARFVHPPQPAGRDRSRPARGRRRVRPAPRRKERGAREPDRVFHPAGDRPQAGRLDGVAGAARPAAGDDGAQRGAGADTAVPHRAPGAGQGGGPSQGGLPPRGVIGRKLVLETALVDQPIVGARRS